MKLHSIVECWHKSDCCWVEVNLVTLTCWGCYQILDICVSLCGIQERSWCVYCLFHYYNDTDGLLGMDLQTIDVHVC